MRRIRFRRAGSLDEALEHRRRFGGDGSVLAGGTDLLVALRLQSASLPPLEVIDLTPLGELRGIRVENGSVRLGALATHDEIERDERLQIAAPLLCAACASIGSPQIRNRGTLGGNVAHASACADSLPPLVALEAVVVAESCGGRREIPASEFLLAPYRTALRADEIVTEVAFRGLGEGERGSFLKLGRRNALSIARMSVAVVLGRGSDGVVRRARIAAGSVVPVARRFPEAEACLDGSRGEEEAVTEAARSLAAAMVRETGRRWSTPYKEPVVQTLARRAIRAALEGESHV